MPGAISFVLFIILFVYYIGKYLSERSASKEFDRKMDLKQSRLDSWISRVTDSELEQEINEFIQDSSNEKYAAFRKELRNTWHMYSDEQYPGGNCMSYTDDTEYLIPLRQDAKRILMANRGKLPDGDASFGFTSPFYSKESRMRDVRFIIGMDKQLRAHGINEPLIAYGNLNTPQHTITGLNDPVVLQPKYYKIKWAPIYY